MTIKESIEPQIASDMRKRWFRILPAVFITYSLAYLDRANYGFGAAAGLAATLNITKSRAALLGAIFFLGYFLFQVPGAAYARKKSARHLVFFALVAWGILAALTGVIRNFWLLVVDRFFLGVAESFILPAMLILLMGWFTRSERSRANTFLILGNPVTVLWMSVVTGYLISAIGWQMTFVVEGIPSVIWGIVWVLLIRDKPREVSWMRAESCSHLERELEREQAQLPSVPKLRVVFEHPGVIWLCIQYFFWSAGVYGFVLWLPVIVKNGTAQGIGATGLLSAAPYVGAVLMMILISHFSDHSSQRKRFIWPFLLISGLAMLGSFFTASISFWLAYACLIVSCAGMYAPYGSFFAIVPEMLPKNVAGEVMALINSFGALGGFVGTWFVGLLEARTGSSKSGFLLMSVCLIISSFIILALKASSPNSLQNKSAAG
ncbi:MAG TPA: MFS transporter [Terriglobales bacterium]|nr:MFS transporter [Terriglobales bacterium]